MILSEKVLFSALAKGFPMFQDRSYKMFYWFWLLNQFLETSIDTRRQDLELLREETAVKRLWNFAFMVSNSSTKAKVSNSAKAEKGNDELM